MIKIQAKGLGKRFNREWIFKGLDLFFQQGEAWAITGPNGSGKSTLMQVISSYAPHSEGKIHYFSEKGCKIELADFYSYISIAAPYLELVEEFTLTELLSFHFQFKQIRDGFTIQDLIHFMYLEKARNKQIKFFSSGMKQRLKLGLAFYSTSPVIILDEPTTNLDFKAIDWYQDELSQILNNRLTLICSNQPTEYEQCAHHLDILEYKN